MATNPALRHFRWIEHFWSPIVGWYARSAEACDGTPEDGIVGPEGGSEASTESCIDPETTLWNELLEEVQAEERPDVDLQDRRLSTEETVWQRRGKEKKRAAVESSADEADGLYLLSILESTRMCRTLTVSFLVEPEPKAKKAKSKKGMCIHVYQMRPMLTKTRRRRPCAYASSASYILASANNLS